MDEEVTITGRWVPTGQRRIETRQVPTVVNGFGRVVHEVPITVEQIEERRPVWCFVGYETRWS